jgi:hypothetical protein
MIFNDFKFDCFAKKYLKLTQAFCYGSFQALQESQLPASGFRGKSLITTNFGEETIMEKTLALAASVLGIVVSVALFAGQVMA